MIFYFSVDDVHAHAANCSGDGSAGSSAAVGVSGQDAEDLDAKQGQQQRGAEVVV
jgi:hypothetical protein